MKSSPKPTAKRSVRTGSSTSHLPASRRQWLKQAGLLAGVGVSSAGFLSSSSILGSSRAQADSAAHSQAGDQSVRLLPAAEQNQFRVRITMEAKGNVDIAANPLISRTSSTKLPLTSDAVFDYEERFRYASGDEPSAADYVTYAERYYHEATVDSQLNRSKQHHELRESVCDTVVRRETFPETIYPSDGYFTRVELDLLRLPISSIGVDGLLPTEAVNEGTVYRPSLDGLASALNLTVVDDSRVEAEVVSLTEKNAKIHFKGDLSGSVEGVSTKLRTVGKLMFDREAGICSWLAIAVHETREIGLAEPGFDVAATIKMIRQPISQSVGLAKARDVDVIQPIPDDRLFVDLVSEQMHFAALMRRQWRLMTDVPGAAMMRMIDSDRSIAQCDFRPLPNLKAGTQLTLEAFAEDVKRTLGEQLAEIVEADQQVAATGLRVLRVVATGAAEGVPIQWVLMHFSDDQGHRVQATFTMEADKLRRFAGADAQLANSLRFVGLSTAEATSESAPEVDELTKETKTSESTRIADAIRSDSEDDEVQSVSDLK